MTHNTSVTRLDQLATEIILDVFDYLSSNDIVYAFCDLNQRLNSILLQHEQCLNSFRIPEKNSYFWENTYPMIGSYIQHLIIDPNGFCFSIDLFSSLKSIIISSSIPVQFDRVQLIMKSKQFANLISFQIKTELFGEINDNETLGKVLFEHIFINNISLQKFECSMKIPASNSNEIGDLKLNKNIHSLSLNLTNFTDVIPLLEYTPNLKYLNLIVTTIGDRNELNHTFDLSSIKLERFSLTCNTREENSPIYEKEFLLLTNVITQFSSSLIYFSMNLSRRWIHRTDTYQFNGHLLRQQLVEPLMRLRTFHLYVQLRAGQINVKSILSTFENQFWFDRNWSIGMHGYYIYTLPFHFDKLEEFIDFDQISSSDPAICNSPQAWRRITSIGFSMFCDLSLNLTKQIISKMPNLTSITFPSSVPRYPKLMEEHETNQMESALNSVTTIECDVQFLPHLKPWLIYILQSVKRLVLFNSHLALINYHINAQYLELAGLYSPSESIPMDYAHFSNIEDVDVTFVAYESDALCKQILCLAKKVLETFQNSKTFLFHFHNENEDSNKPIDYPEKMMRSLSGDKTLKNYQLDSIDNCLQLTKTNNESLIIV